MWGLFKLAFQVQVGDPLAVGSYERVAPAGRAHIVGNLLVESWLCT